MSITAVEAQNIIHMRQAALMCIKNKDFIHNDALVSYAQSILDSTDGLTLDSVQWNEDYHHNARMIDDRGNFVVVECEVDDDFVKVKDENTSTVLEVDKSLLVFTNTWGETLLYQ